MAKFYNYHLEERVFFIGRSVGDVQLKSNTSLTVRHLFYMQPWLRTNYAWYVKKMHYYFTQRCATLTYATVATVCARCSWWWMATCYKNHVTKSFCAAAA